MVRMNSEIRSLYLIGAGGHARVVADILNAAGVCPAAFVDRAPTRREIAGVPVIPGETIPDSSASVIVAIGDNFVRERIAAGFARFAVAIHPTAVLGGDVEIGEGSVVMAGAVINAGARIGRHCIVNTRASIDHDCVICDFAHVAPGATLGGGARVGRGSMIGLGANVIHGREIGDYSVVGAGSTVVRDIADGVLAVGTPARAIRSRAPGDRYL